MKHPLPCARYYLPAVIVFLLLTNFTVYYTPTPEPPDGPLNDDLHFNVAPTCEECKYTFLPWGPLTSMDVPMYGGACTR